MKELDSIIKRLIEERILYHARELSKEMEADLRVALKKKLAAAVSEVSIHVMKQVTIERMGDTLRIEVEMPEANRK